MKLNSRILPGALALIVVVAACDKKSPTSPSDATSGAAAGQTSGAPALASPNDQAQIGNADQPVKLVVTNADTTGSSTTTYTFEVATDAAFSNKVFSRDGVAPGSNGQTSLTIDKIGAGKSYYWHARVNRGGVAGPFANARSFAIGPDVSLQ